MNLILGSVVPLAMFLLIFSTFIIFPQKTSSPPSKHFFFFFQTLGSRYNLVDLSRTICSCLNISLTGFYMLSNRLLNRWLGSLLEGRGVRWVGRGVVFICLSVSLLYFYLYLCLYFWPQVGCRCIYLPECFTFVLTVDSSLRRYCLFAIWHFLPPVIFQEYFHLSCHQHICTSCN